MLNVMKLASFGLVCAVVSAVPAGAVARNTTRVTFDQPVVASGQVLAAGEYSLERVESNLVAVSKDGQFITLVPAEPASRVDVGATVVTLRNAGGAAPVLDSWYFDGERSGLVFKTAPAARPAGMAKPCASGDAGGR